MGLNYPVLYLYEMTLKSAWFIEPLAIPVLQVGAVKRSQVLYLTWQGKACVIVSALHSQSCNAEINLGLGFCMTLPC